jgi:hypothetical protein
LRVRTDRDKGGIASHRKSEYADTRLIDVRRIAPCGEHVVENDLDVAGAVSQVSETAGRALIGGVIRGMSDRRRNEARFGQRDGRVVVTGERSAGAV